MQIQHHFGAHVYVKETAFLAGEWGEKHVHDFDHLSFLVSGRVRLSIDEAVSFLAGPVSVTVQAGKTHQVHALSDAVWLCIHHTECTDPESVDLALMMGT